MSVSLIALAVPAVAAGSTQRRPVCDFTELALQVQEGGWLRRRCGYYWVRLIGAAAVLVGWVFLLVWLGDTWWQLMNAVAMSVLLTQIAFLGHEAAQLPLIQPLVQALCAAVGIPYTQITLWQFYGLVVRYLNTVGLQGRDLFLCPLDAARRSL